MTSREITQTITTLLATRRTLSSLTDRSDIDKQVEKLRRERTVETKKRLVELKERKQNGR